MTISPRLVDSLSIDIPLTAVPAEQVLEGSPQTGVVECGSTADYDWGVWEMSPGVMWDVEVDETFVVVSGSGQLTRTLDGLEQTITLSPGVVVTLDAGERTTWRIDQSLRKVWWCPAGS